MASKWLLLPTTPLQFSKQPKAASYGRIQIKVLSQPDKLVLLWKALTILAAALQATFVLAVSLSLCNIY